MESYNLVIQILYLATKLSQEQKEIGTVFDTTEHKVGGLELQSLTHLRTY